MNSRFRKLLLLGNVILGLLALSAKAATAPTISTQPVATLAAAAGTSPNIKVVANGSTLTYVWRKDNVAIPGAHSSANLSFPTCQTSQSGSYSVVVSNAGGAVTSRVSQVTIWQPVVLTQSPLSQTAAAGNTVRLTAVAAGFPAPSYQWKFKGANVAGATGPQLVLANVQTNQSGAYTVTAAHPYSTVTSAAATLLVGLPPVITEQPGTQLAAMNGKSVVFDVSVTGAGPLAFSWYKDGVVIPGETTYEFLIRTVVGTSAGVYTVVASNPFGTVTSAPMLLHIFGIEAAYLSQTVAPGGNVSIPCLASGTPAPTCQWFSLGGYPIAGATNATLCFTNVTLREAGYYYMFANYGPGQPAGYSSWAQVTVPAPALPFADVFARRGTLTGASGLGTGSNDKTSTEDGEPVNYGYKVKYTVWLRWVAPTNGVVEMNTEGSNFDTILGVYTGSALTNLTLVANDDDSGGFLNSKVQFSVQTGVEYNLVVAGFDGTVGAIAFAWNLTASDVTLPVVTAPVSFAGTLGNPVNLTVSYTGNNNPVGVQWLFEGQPIPDATNDTYNLPALQLAHLGVYQARLVTGPFTRCTPPADVQVNSEGLQHVIVQNRQAEADRSSLNGWNPMAMNGWLVAPLRRRITAMIGYSGTQIFATRAGKDPGEPDHCGVIGGSSYWLRYVPPVTGTVFLSTAGSSYDTLLAVYTDDGLGLGYASLLSVACNDNDSPANLTSKVSFNGTAGVAYYVVVDGKNGAYGTACLNYKVSAPPTLSALAAMTILEDTSTGARPFTIGDAETTAANLSVTATSSAPAIVPASGLVLGGTGASRTLNVIPAANQNGSVTITVTVTDADGIATTSAFTLTITPVNDAPVAGTDTRSRVLNRSVSVAISTLLANDTDVDRDARTLTAVSSLSYLGATITKTSTSVTYTAKRGVNGSDYFTYIVSDGKGGTTTGRVNMNVQ